MSNETKPSPISLGNFEAIERVAMERGKQRQREHVVEAYRFQHQPILLPLVTKHVGTLLCSSLSCIDDGAKAIRKNLWGNP